MTCVWKVDDCGIWCTSCENMFELTSGDPHENGFRFCPYCGEKLSVLIEENKEEK
jgi:rRNA maturation endonuclease Nob1